MLVYGPSYVWEAEYSVTTTCTGCLRPDECLSDADCGSGETCQPNGAACITYPCDVAYDICKPAESCADSSDCSDGFCGWDAGGSRVCKPYRNEGESCGGFTLPEFRYECRPDLECKCTEPTCDAPGVCE
jgi:Cys-rich repeat protein